MNKVIEQKVHFKGATAEDLFDIFVNPQKHSIIHGGAATKISSKVGDSFSLINGKRNSLRILFTGRKSQFSRRAINYDL